MSRDPAEQESPALRSDSPASAPEVLSAFLKLGLTSFGGPVAHLGYFRTEFVERRQWLDDRSYSDLVALCQFLPGPASSQVGMALGLQRAGWLGALMAWVGFTLPSALALIVFAYGIVQYGDLASSGAVHGLKVVAVAVVAQAVWGMAKSLCPDRPRAGLAIAAALVTLVLPSALGQVGAILACGLVGWLLLKLPHQEAVPHVSYGVSRTAGIAALALSAALLLGLPALAIATDSPLWVLVDGFYRAGALVFGGGHVVLPLLQSTVVPIGAVSNSDFLAGYGATQAVPGPLFTFAAYLGAVMGGPLTGWVGGLVFLVVIFVPAFLLVVGALPFWTTCVKEMPSELQWQASMRVWLASCFPRCTTQSGPARSWDGRILASRSPPSGCWSMAVYRRFSWSSWALLPRTLSRPLAASDPSSSRVPGPLPAAHRT